MKATFQIPDELYREVKAETAREGRTLRDVTITLFEQWLRQKSQRVRAVPGVEWRSFPAPLGHLVPDDVTNHSMEAMRESVVDQWDEHS